MKKKKKYIIIILVILTLGFISGFVACNGHQTKPSDDINTCGMPEAPLSDNAKIIFLHHSTGGNVYRGGIAPVASDKKNVQKEITAYNNANSKNYQIYEENFPKSNYGVWANYPFDYYDIWVAHAGNSPYKNQKTLEMLTPDYDMIIWKHCFPVCDILADDGHPLITANNKTIANYKLQYEALKSKMREFPNTRFIVWTGAVKVNMPNDRALRAKEFFDWVKNEWDEKGDNIFVWDFYALETEGDLHLKSEYAKSPTDSHPNTEFCQKVVPKFAKRIIDVIQGYGDINPITGD